MSYTLLTYTMNQIIIIYYYNIYVSKILLVNNKELLYSYIVAYIVIINGYNIIIQLKFNNNIWLYYIMLKQVIK